MSGSFISGCLVLCLAAAALNVSSCRTLDDALECLGESALFDVSHTVDTANTLTVDLILEYSGQFDLSGTIEWNFGDGQEAALNGTTAQHTYSSAGTYTVTAVPTVTELNEVCSPEITETVTVN